jgi:hypothetical protein
MDSTKEERALELAKAEEAFNTMAEKGTDRIVVSNFPQLLRNLNVIYREEEHKVTLKKITEGEDVTVITRSAFLDCLDGWYKVGGGGGEEIRRFCERVKSYFYCRLSQTVGENGC